MDLTKEVQATGIKINNKRYNPNHSMKSVFRLMPISTQISDDPLKEQQIDEIRRKLKMMSWKNDRRKNSSQLKSYEKQINDERHGTEQKQNQIKYNIMQRSGHILSMLLGKKESKKRQNIQVNKDFGEKKGQNSIIYKLDKPMSQPITQHRKIKTQYQQFLFDFNIKKCQKDNNTSKDNVNRNLKIQSNKQSQLIPPSPSYQNMGFDETIKHNKQKQNKSSKYIISKKKLWSNFKISDQLKNLKQQYPNDTTQSNDVLQSKESPIYDNNYINRQTSAKMGSESTCVDSSQKLEANSNINARKIIYRKISITPILPSDSDKIIQQQGKDKEQNVFKQLPIVSAFQAQSRRSVAHLRKSSKTNMIDYKSNKTIKRQSINLKYQMFIDFVRNSLGLSLLKNRDDGDPLWKFYIVKGNNDDLPRRLLSKRKWVQTYRIGQAHFVWSPKRQQNYINNMSSMNLQIGEDKINKLIKYQLRCHCKKLVNKNSQCQCNYKKLINNCESTNSQIKTYQNGHDISIIFDSNKLNKIDGQQIRSLKIHNHLLNNHQIAYKKLLFMNLKKYYQSKNEKPFQHIPLTFHINSFRDIGWTDFLSQYRKYRLKTTKTLWIIKPGQNTNRGNGIKVFSQLQDIREQVTQILQSSNITRSSVIIQLYIMPMLYNKRKFDIRCYVMILSINNSLKVYWYQQGYIRTSCKQFSTTDIQNKFIHLTNDAVQKNSNDYGKYQSGNKISFQILQKYIENNYPNKSMCFQNDIYPKMVQMTKDIFQSSYQKLHDFSKDVCFQIFGLDFLIDQQLKPWLIQVNRNPCLETSTSLLSRIITQMLQNSFKIAIDPIFMPKNEVLQNQKCNVFSNKYKLIFSKPVNNKYNQAQNFMKVCDNA